MAQLSEKKRVNGSQWQDYVENCCPPDFRPFPGNPVVDAVIEELLQLQLAQQETINRFTGLVNLQIAIENGHL